ncbi:MAG: DUF3486 family protein [Nitratireductor sp.]|nr:DUF3486 family protein [Nitratireductor sp.]
MARRGARRGSRRGRGRLSAIDRLPAEADDIIAWASNELRDRDRTQQEIYEEFFGKLEELKREHHGELEFDIPSKSAFNRYSIFLATMTRRMEETREIAGAIAKRFDAEASDDLTLIAAEAIKTLVYEVLTDAGRSGIDPKGAKSLADALRSAALAQNISTKRRKTVEDQFREQASKAIEMAGEEAGLDAATITQLKQEFLGMRPKQEAADDDAE